MNHPLRREGQPVYGRDHRMWLLFYGIFEEDVELVEYFKIIECGFSMLYDESLTSCVFLMV